MGLNWKSIHINRFWSSPVWFLSVKSVKSIGYKKILKEQINLTEQLIILKVETRNTREQN